jgi:hypothetical protein
VEWLKVLALSSSPSTAKKKKKPDVENEADCKWVLQCRNSMTEIVDKV